MRPKNNPNALLLLPAALALSVATTAQAAVTYSLTGHGTAPALLNDWAGEADGYEFVVGGSDLSVSWLGFYDAQNGDSGAVGDGLFASHQVSIWKVSDGSTVATTIVLAGTADSLVGSFRGHEIGPVTLLAGSSYIIAANYDGSGDREREGDDLTGWGINGITIAGANAGRYGGTGGAMPTGEWATMISANFGYTLVPEPAAAFLGGVGLIALLRRRRNV